MPSIVTLLLIAAGLLVITAAFICVLLLRLPDVQICDNCNHRHDSRNLNKIDLDSGWYNCPTCGMTNRIIVVK